MVNVNLENRTIIVAGVGPGLGMTLVHYLSEECSARVIALAKDEQICEMLHQESTEKLIETYLVDLVDELQTASIFSELDKNYPAGIQGLVNNAYIPFIVKDQEDINKITREDFVRVFENNVYSAFRASQLAIPLMKKSEPVLVEGTPVLGTIVTIGSNVSHGVSPHKPFYGASKAALASISHSFAHWFGQDGIVSVCLEPGDLTTPRTSEYIAATKREEKLANYLERTALNRSGSPVEIAKIVAFCLNPYTALLTGSVITADGGYSSRF